MTELLTHDVILWTAASVAVIHTAIGVDHIVPFVALARARGWSMSRALAITALCGVGHVASSVLLGLVGVAAGVALEKLSWLESVRGSLAAWSLIAFGLAYAAWGVWRHLRQRQHAHLHTHDDGTVHAHPHHHVGAHQHPHGASSVTTWTLFVLFVLGPCEPLIPLMMAPAAGGEPWMILGVVALFGLATVGTMMVLVAAALWGLQKRPWPALERHAHIVAGLVIAVSGVMVQAFGI